MISKRPNIGIDIRMINFSGIGVYIRNLVPKVLGLIPRADFYLYGNPTELEKFEWTRAKNSSVVRLIAPIYSIQEQWDLFRKISKRIDIFWSPHYNFPLLIPSKLIVTVHDLIHLAMPELYSGLAKRFYSKIMFHRLSKKADKIICISNFTLQELLRLTNCDRNKIKVIHNGFGNSHLDIPPRISSPNSPYFLFVGNIKPHKNLSCLIKAYSLIEKKIPHNLYIIGSDFGMITVDHEAKHLSLQAPDRIFFKKNISDEELASYYQNAECLIFPSLYEGFGLPPLEAMTFQCPVLSSNAASMPEVCGDAAMYFNPDNPQELADKMLLIANSEKIRSTLIKKGLVRYKSFSWNTCAEEMALEIERLLFL